jgi:hypothetical protein
MTRGLSGEDRHQFLTDEAISGVKAGCPIASHSLPGVTLITETRLNESISGPKLEPIWATRPFRFDLFSFSAMELTAGRFAVA